ncbi:MAG: universal stress protein [Proteobacteria bacterium]|nr:universal stress protein [Pseudomonadota bacterium]
MNKKILIGVDGSIHAKHAIKYAAELYRSLRDVSYGVINIQPTISCYLADEAEKTAYGREKLEAIHKKNHLSALELLSEYREKLIRLGVKAGDIDQITQLRRHNVAKDLLDYAEKENVCALLVGRRGISYVAEMMLGSVTSELLIRTKLIPIWIVDNQVQSRNIVVAVDGSPGSLRAVDHVSFVQAGSKSDKITFLHIVPKFSDFCSIEPVKKDEEIDALIKTSDQKCIDCFYDQAVKILQQAGYSKKDIEFKRFEHRWFIGKAIVEEAKKLNAGTIVIGKSSSGQADYIGKVARYVINKTVNRAIWLVP